MNIGIFTECYKPTINGVVISIETFKRELEKLGHQVFIFCPEHKKGGFQPNVFRFPSITLPSPKDYPLALPFLSPSLFHFITSSLSLDIVHTQHIFLMGSLGQKVARTLKIPCLHTYHTLMTEYTHYFPIKSLRNLVKKIIIFRSRNFCQKANKIIVPSTGMIEVLRSYGIKRPIEVLPTGIYLEEFKRLDLRSKRKILANYGIPFKKKILLYVGRLAEEKNLDFLLKCFLEIKKGEPDAHLVFVGSGPYEKNLKSQILNLKINKEVTLTGFLEKGLANQFFGLADLFVFPSTTDTQGIVLVEAMASSTPCLAINRLGPADIVENEKNGFLTELNKEEFVEKAMILLKDKKLWQKLSEGARKRAKDFEAKKIAQKLVKIYHDLTH